LSQSKKEQRDYLKNVELARVLDKRAQRKGDAKKRPATDEVKVEPDKKRKATERTEDCKELDDVLSRIF